jgi:hypothetical protein
MWWATTVAVSCYCTSLLGVSTPSYVVGTGFESWPTDQLHWHVFHGFTQALKAGP